MSEDLKIPMEPSSLGGSFPAKKVKKLPEKKVFIITYHFKMSPPRKFRIRAYGHLDALKLGDKLPYLYLKERLSELVSYDVELETSLPEEKPDKSLRIGFNQTPPVAADKSECDPNDVPF